ncbi:MAG: hypothetical protein A2542_02395 [Parcubacteria group bacterium RIFOXYD2_FULL_52_8]|nr:MAG: hypothetical protein A2542_02395 [Parcubacteria group bacterium RIFOXYD2_FULL_52_8]
MNLYLIRHGETDVNRILNHGVSGPMHSELVTFKEGGDTDIALNVYGRAQAEEAAKYLPDHINEIYSSALLRVKETAEIIAGLKGIPASAIYIRPELAEYHMGTLEGLSLEKKNEAAAGKTWGSGLLCTYDYSPWGGDTWETIHDRLRSFFTELKEKHGDGETIVCVTSAGVIRMTYKLLLSALAPDLTRHIKVENGSVHKFVL